MRSVRGRLMVAFGLTAVLSVVVTGIIAIGLLRRQAEGTARADLTKIAQAIAAEDPTVIGNGGVAGLGIVRRVLAINGDEAALVYRGGTALGDAAAVAQSVNLQPLIQGGQVQGKAGGFVYVGVPVS